MKYLRITLLLAFSIVIQPAIADDNSLVPADVHDYIGYGVAVAMLVLIIIAIITLLQTIKVLNRIVLKSKGYTEEQIIADMEPLKAKKKSNGEVWNRHLLLKPLNLFYTTIAFAVIYVLIFHVFGIGQAQGAENETKIVKADIGKKEFLSKSANNVDENTVKLVTYPTVVASGQAIFIQYCAACHGAQGQGVVGPNLTDDYWLHGGKIGDVFKTIKDGVPAKAMPTWGKQLLPKQISDVANYVKSLHGTNPPNAKAPQGIKEI